MLPLLLSLGALAGYGDPVDGHPMWTDRAVHLWTNAARVAPEAWTHDYSSGGRPCRVADFRPQERIPRPGLRWNHDLGEAARAHTNDMVDNEFFSHTSSDGTRWNDRIARYYPHGTTGENIARGYSNSRAAVLSGWMCSPGHRANIMSDLFDEVGTSERSAYYTQNFGGRGLAPRAVASAIHVPQNPTTWSRFFADVWVEPTDFDQVVVVLEGVEFELDLVAGEEGRGFYGIELDVTSECHRWYVEVRTLSEAPVRYPEEGSWGWGDCTWDDEPTRWVAQQLDSISPDPDPDPSGEDLSDPDEAIIACEGCRGSPLPLSWALPFLVVAALRRQRRPTSTR